MRGKPPARWSAQTMMTFEKNLIMRRILRDRGFVAENRVPLFRSTLSRDPEAGCLPPQKIRMSEAAKAGVPSKWAIRTSRPMPVPSASQIRS